MVTAVTSFGRSGLSDWLVQRFSAVVLAAYTIFIVAFIFATPDFGFEQWSALYSQMWMRAFSLLALLSIAAHGWIGLWAVLTDYVTERFMGGKALVLRIVVLTVYALTTVTYLVWGVEVLWGFK